MGDLGNVFKCYQPDRAERDIPQRRHLTEPGDGSQGEDELFFEEDVQTNILHIRASERPSLESKGVTIESIGKRLGGQELEPFFISLTLDSESGRRQVIHSGHEFVYCVRGRMEYEIDGDIYMLAEGDFLLFEAELPHHWRNPTQEKAELPLILQTPDGSDEPVRRHFSGYPSVTHVG